MNKRFFALLICIVPFFFGPSACRSQNPVTPPQVSYSCPPLGTYAALPGAGNGSTSTAFTATAVSSQTCFAAQPSLPAANGVVAQNGTPTNIVGPYIGGPLGEVTLGVQCKVPTPNPNNQTCTGDLWTFLYAPAVTATAPGPASGTMGTATTSQVIKPAPPEAPAVANNVPAGTLSASRQ